MTSLNRLSALTLGVASVSLLGISGAFADTLTQSGTYGPSTVAANSNISFNKFDPSLGTLNSVTLTLSGNFTITITVDNTQNGQNPTPTTKTFSSASAFVTGGINATGPDGSTFSLSQSQLTLTVNQANGYSAADRTLAANTTKDYTKSINSTAQTVLTSGSNDLSSYQGTGGSTFLVAVDNGDLNVGGAGGLGLGYSAVAPIAGSVSIAYNYTPSAAPEPGSFVLAGMGLVSMGGVAVRRRKKFLVKG